MNQIENYLQLAQEHIHEFNEVTDIERRRQCYDIVHLFVDNANLLGAEPKRVVLFLDSGMEIAKV